jgi:HTH-type transcriptional regulator/antitoxin HigA
MQEVVALSVKENGPFAAQEFLLKHGIPLIIEPHLPQTYLDGAALLLLDERPIIGMTIRYDRLDNFWFTLMHELAHVVLHFGKGRSQFIDDLDVGPKDDQIEREADSLAGETLIPLSRWRTSAAAKCRYAAAALQLAGQLNVHPAIVAGRMRHHWKAFRLLNNLVGHHEVRKCFPEVQWPN